MKVLFVSNDPTIFIAGHPTRERMKAYAKKLGELHVISRAARGAKEETEGELTLHPVRAPRIISLLLMREHARRIIRSYGIQVVSAQDPFEHGWIARSAVRGTSAKLHIQVHTDFLSPWFTKNDEFRAPKGRVPLVNRVRIRLAERVLPDAAGIRVVSRRVADSLIEHFGKRIPEPVVISIVPSEVLQPSVPLPTHDFTFSLITVGRLEPEKRIEDILYAIARLQHQYPSVGIFVVGGGREQKRLEGLAKRLGLEYKAIFLGERADAQGLMRSAHAYIQASAYEGYGRTLIEAALAKIPIITTDVGIVGEVFRGYEDVLSAPVADPAALAVHIAGLVEDHQARIALAMNAERRAKAHVAENRDSVGQVAADLARLA